MVEIERSKMTSNSSAVVKLEKRDDQEEIDQLAAKMVEANKAKMASMVPAPGQINPLNPSATPGARMMPGTLLGYFSRNSAGVGAKEAVENMNKEKFSSSASLDDVSEDVESAKGRFGWTDAPVPIPYIYRRSEKRFCALRILEQRVSRQFSNVLRPELSGCISIESHYISDVEARLLHEINAKHCDWQFGREPFNVRDVLVSLDDALELIQFLQTCQDKLVRKSCEAEDRCGFFRIGGESVVPYTLVDGVKYVPLFYFEGETGNLDKRAIQITGWDLAYLKLCCKVQGIRNELFSNDSYSAVSVDEIKQQFPPQTELQLYWPSRSLMDVQTSAGTGTLEMWVKKPKGVPPQLPVTSIPAAASSVIQKNPAPLPRPSTSTGATVQPPAVTMSSRAPVAPAANSSNQYNGWNRTSYAAVQQMHQPKDQAASSHGSSSIAAAASNLASVLQSQQQAVAAVRAQAAVSAILGGQVNPLMPSMPVPHPYMMQYAQAVLSMQQQQQQQQQQQASRSHPAPLPPPAPPAQSRASPATQSSSLDSLLRSNGIHVDMLRPPHGSPSGTVMNRSTYSSSQSPLTGVVPGSSPHSRSSTGASPRPGLPVPSSSLVHASHASSSSSSSTSSSTTSKPPPPPLIPVNGSLPAFPTMPSSSSAQAAGRVSEETRSYHSAAAVAAAAAAQPQLLHRHPAQVQNPSLLQQQQLPQAAPPFKLQLYQIENQTVPCVNSRQYVYNNLMIALPDMAAYLFPQFGHQTCKQVLQDGVGVTLYEANPQQMQVLKSAGKVSSVGSLGVERVSLVNVRDVVQYMPQIRFIMSRLDASAELSHNHPSKRQRVS